MLPRSRGPETNAAPFIVGVPGLRIWIDVGKLRVCVADGVADVGDDLERVGVTELGAVALVEQLDEFAELAHRDLPLSAAGAGPVAGDRAQGGWASSPRVIASATSSLRR